MKSATHLSLIILPVLLLALMVSSADLYLWSKADDYRTPIRALVLGDQDYYQIRVHQTLVSGGLIESPFFLEHAYGHPRFVVFESLLLVASKVLGLLIDTNRVVWANLLRIVMVIALYFEWLYVFRHWAKFSAGVSVALALAVNLWQEPFAALVQYALGSWFLPFAFFGIIAAVNGFLELKPRRRWAWHVAASLAFAVHPIAFTIGNFALGLVWLKRLWTEHSLKTLLASAAWAVPVFALGLWLFGSFLTPHGLDAAQITAETLVRNARVATHLPVMPLAVVRVASLLALIVVCRRRAADDLSRAAWDMLLACQVTVLIGQNANLITGSYFLNDHFQFADRIIGVLAAALAWKTAQRQPTRAERTVAILALVGIGADAVGLLVSHPISSWLVLGAQVPYLLSGLLLIWIVGGRPHLPLPRFPVSKLTVLLVVISAAYAFVFIWRLNRGFVAANVTAQDARPVLQELSTMPQGVVLADPWLSGFIAADSAHRPYWTPRAFLDEASNQELKSRWEDALTVFPDDTELSGPQARLGLFGTENQFCDSLVERRVYQPMANRGLVKQSLCRMTMSDEVFTSFLQVERQKEKTAGRDWKPSYRLDLVIFDAEKGERVPTALTHSFARLWSEGRWSVYAYSPAR